MTTSINKVILVGNLGVAPEFREFPNGDQICTLSIATNASWKDRLSGEWREATQWHRVVVRAGNLMSRCKERLQKGDLIYLEGCLETRSWTEVAGQVRYATEIVLRPFRSELKVLKSTKIVSSANPYEGDGAATSNHQVDPDIPF